MLQSVGSQKAGQDGATEGQQLPYSGLPQWFSRKNLPAREGDADLILGREDPLKKEMATHSSILTWEIPQTEEPGGL